MSGTVSAYQTANGKRWRVRYRKPDKTQTDKRGFKTKREAETYLATVTVKKSTGDYIDPALSRVTVGDLAQQWLDGKKGIKPSAYAELPRAWRLHVEPIWGHRELRSILPSEIQTWVTQLGQPPAPEQKGKSASVVLRALGVLAGILDMAVDDRRITRNPARGLKTLPKKSKKKLERVYLTHDQLHTLATEAKHSTLVLVLGYTGLRWGEATALRVRHVNMLRRRLHVIENAVQVNGVTTLGEPKDWEQRSVPFPAFLSKPITELMRGKGPNDLLFGNGKTHMKPPRFGDGWLDNAITRLKAQNPAFPRVTAHDLRHTAASLAVAAGANVKALQAMRGGR